jgi:hypothetical protein
MIVSTKVFNVKEVDYHLSFLMAVMAGMLKASCDIPISASLKRGYITIKQVKFFFYSSILLLSVVGLESFLAICLRCSQDEYCHSKQGSRNNNFSKDMSGIITVVVFMANRNF